LRDFLTIAKALSDETRVRALLSVKDGELCLCQIVDVLGLSPATVSKHLNLLYHAGLVQRRKDGKWHYYRMSDGDGNPSARRALDWVLGELDRDRTVRDDVRRIRAVRRKNLSELSACYRS
jgi:ArsR family transcriptional regulator, arsenate/arsenite/antimonite-responsive transcriptional repressor